MHAPAVEPSRVSVVLVRPRFSENVGAVARALENVGGGALLLVAPNEITLDGMAARVARGGEERLRAARVVATLDEAIQGVDLAVATSHRQGKRRIPLLPWELTGQVIPSLAPRSVALVMGPEDSGLGREELDACHRQVSIPTHGPMNLAQATVILLYELCVRPQARPAEGGAGAPGVAGDGAADPHVRFIVETAAKALARVDYPHHRRPMQREMARLADLLARIGPMASWEANFLAGIFRAVDHWARKQEGSAPTEETFPDSPRALGDEPPEKV